MSQNKSIKYIIIFIVLSLIAFQSNILAQDKKTCLFVSDDPWPGSTQDQDLIAYLEQTYTVEIYDDDTEIQQGIPSLEEIKAFDFGFVSEMVDSKTLIPLKGVPIPLMYLEVYGRTYTTGWCPHPGEFWGGVGSGTIKIVDDTGHPLAAGFAKDAEIEIVKGSDEDAWLTFCDPGVDFIPIAVLASDPTHNNIFGIEAGTALFPNAANEVDPTLLSENRCVGFGIHSGAYSTMTEDSWKFIDAGIAWILGEEIAVDKISTSTPIDFNLAQNFPNPFNPETKIEFQLRSPGHTTISVYNSQGQLITTLVNENLESGTHYVTFRGENYSSGVYFYRINSGVYSSVRKMLLMK